MALLVGGLCLLAPLEQAVFGESHLAIEPFATAMQVVGLPHIVIGFLFMATSQPMQCIRRRLFILLGLAAGAALCWLLHVSGGPKARPNFPMIFVGLFFLTHAFRDERLFYRRYGEERRGAGRSQLPLLLCAFFCAVLGLVWSLVMIGLLSSREMPMIAMLQALPPMQRLQVWALPCIALGGLGWVSVRVANRRSGQCLRTLLGYDRPLWWVYIAALITVLACSLLGGKFHAFVLLHVIAWWVFASVGYTRRKQVPAAFRGLWTWMRTTQIGFQTLHGGLSLLVLTLLLWYFNIDPSLRETPWAWMLDRDSFYYWTVMHVTVSFVPKT